MGCISHPPYRRTKPHPVRQTRPTAVPNPVQCVSSKMLIRKLSGNKLGAAGPPFQKKVLAVLSMKIG